MDELIEKKILAMDQAEKKLYDIAPKMKDPEWWSGDGCGDAEMNEHDLQLQKELAEKAGIKLD